MLLDLFNNHLSLPQYNNQYLNRIHLASLRLKILNSNSRRNSKVGSTDLSMELVFPQLSLQQLLLTRSLRINQCGGIIHNNHRLTHHLATLINLLCSSSCNHRQYILGFMDLAERGSSGGLIRRRLDSSSSHNSLHNSFHSSLHNSLHSSRKHRNRRQPLFQHKHQIQTPRLRTHHLQLPRKDKERQHLGMQLSALP